MGANTSRPRCPAAAREEAEAILAALDAGSTALRAGDGTLAGSPPPATTGGGEDGDRAVGALASYEASAAARARESLVRRLADALGRAGFAVKAGPGADLDEIVAAVRGAIPHPARNGKKFSDDERKQAAACKKIAEAMNEAFTPGAAPPDRFVDPGLAPEALCAAVAEWARAFAAGVNTDYIATHAAVRRAVRRLELLDRALAEAHARLGEAFDAGADERARAAADGVRALYARAQAERARQLEVLKGILHVTLPPSAELLAVALREDSEDHEVARRLGLAGHGSGAALARRLSAVATASEVAVRAHKALRAAGLSVAEYIRAGSLRELERELDAARARLERERGLGYKELTAFLDAAQTLRATFEETRGARAELEALGGAEEDPKGPVARRLEKERAERRLVVADFAARLARLYDDLLAAARALGARLGRDVPLGDRTDALRDALERLEGAADAGRRTELALVGLYVDAAARETRERFVGALRGVAAAAGDLAASPAHAAAAESAGALRAAAEAIVKTVEGYSDVVVRKLGGEDEPVEGGAPAGDADLLPEVARSALTLRAAIAEFRHRYYVARVRENLARAADEVEGYGEKYETILGDAVAHLIYKLEAAHRETVAKIEAAEKMDAATRAAAMAAVPMTNPWARCFDYATYGAGVELTAEQKAAVRKLLVDRLATELDAKAQLYRVVQAVDVYLKAFTAAAAKDPDAMRDIRKILDGVQVIARWFNEQTGEDLAYAFEEMRAANATGVIGEPGPANIRTATGKYLDEVSANAMRGHPGLGRQMVAFDTTSGKVSSAAEALDKRIAGAVDNFQGLKNLVNAFARVGDMFAGRSVERQTFMRPAQIHRALQLYLRVSAVSLSGATAELPSAEYVGANVAGALHPGYLSFGLATVNAATPAAFRGAFVESDAFFTYVIKAMAAKVLTVIGAFDLFERDSPPQTIAPVRVILGGAEGDVEALPEAAELYFRLPRIVEFYRAILRAPTAPSNYSIALLPDLEGVYAGLIRHIFLKAATPESGEYSESELRDIVAEVNAVYRHYAAKAPGRVTLAAVEDLVAEVNRRYARASRAELSAYKDLIRVARSGDAPLANQTDFGILPDEGLEAPELPAPSDRVAVSGDPAKPFQPWKGREDELDVNSARDLVRGFRKLIDGEIRVEHAGSTSYSVLIRQAEREMRAAPASGRLPIAFKLIQGVAGTGLDSAKSLMFLETVIVGLGVLTHITRTLERYKNRVVAHDPTILRNRILDVLGELRDAGGFAPVPDINTLITRAVQRASTDGYADATERDTHVTSLYYAAGFVNSTRPALTGTTAGGVRDMIAANRDFTAWVADANGAKGTPTSDRQRVLRAGARLLVNSSELMRMFLENTFALAQSGLADVRFTSSAAKIHLGFAKTRSLVEALLNDVKQYLDKLRPYVDAAVIKDYEDATKEGSVYWLEKHLIDAFFREPPTGDDRAPGIDKLAIDAARMFENLCKSTGVNVAPDAANADQYLTPVGPPDGSAYEQYGSLVADMIAGAAAIVAPGGNLETTLDALIAIPKGVPIVYSRISRRPFYGMEPPRDSILAGYNHLVSRMISCALDLNGSKIYAPLFNGFAAGYASQSTNSPAVAAFPDVAKITAPGTVPAAPVVGDPKPHALLAQSLALVFGRLYNEKSTGATPTPLHLVHALIDVPLYVKEQLRANLPNINRMLELLAAKSDFFKQVITKTDIKLQRSVPPAGAFGDYLGGGAATHPAIDDIDATAAADAGTRQRMSAILDGFYGGALALATSARDLLKEMADTPLYLQTGEGSIDAYKTRYGVLPLMPLSFAATAFDQNLTAAGYEKSPLYPLKTIGQPAFKLAYGLRAIYADASALGYSQMPGVEAILAAYNAASSSREAVDQSAHLAFCNRVISGFRALVTTRVTTAALSAAVIVGEGPASSIAPPVETAAGYVESQDQRQSTEALTAKITAAGAQPGGADRKKERMRNLVELNVIPINVHALMRSTPLANLYNYEYTFMEAVRAIYGAPADPTNRPTLALFLKLTDDPYAATTDYLQRICGGDDSLQMGRPKFIYDQIYSKVMLSAYPTRVDRVQTHIERGTFASILTGLSAELAYDVAAWNRNLAATQQRLNAILPYVDERHHAVLRTALDATTAAATSVPLDVGAYVNARNAYIQMITDLLKQFGVAGPTRRIGYARFNARLVRNLFFITNVNRLIRLKLHRELVHSRSVIVASHAAVAPGVTEYGADPFSPTETYDSMLPFDQTRYDDQK